MSLYSYRYKHQELPQDTRLKRIYFLFGLTAGLFLFVIALPISLVFPSFHKVASPVLANPEVKGIYTVEANGGDPVVSPTDTVQLTPTSTPPNVNPSPSSTPTSLPQPTNYQTGDDRIFNGDQPARQTAAKSDYSIVVYGDSMVDTMGERLEYLEHALKRKYPNVNFTLYNFGKGAENVEMGLNRFGSELHYQDRNYPNLYNIKPDIIIVGSFAYNPFTPYDRDRHWLGLTKLILKAKELTTNSYILAEIAPLRKDFGKGPNGVNWEEQTNYEHSGRIIEQLENAVGLSKALNIPLIDSFNPSLATADEGKRIYVNPGDGIHPNVAGHEFMAEKIADVMQLH